MGITQKEADALEWEFINAMPKSGDYTKKSARKLLKAWNYLFSLMERENIFTDRLGIESIDWQIGNWANDTVEVIHNAQLYEEEIQVNEQILQIHWSGHQSLFHENAKRNIADAYADMGRVEECYRLYEEYLKEDPLWGWGWIGYYRQLQTYDDARFETTLHELYEKVKAGVDFRDKEDLFRELGDEYYTLGNEERADYFYELQDRERSRHGNIYHVWKPDILEEKPKKVYPNDPCPCESGKKYKKCCGKR